MGTRSNAIVTFRMERQESESYPTLVFGANGQEARLNMNLVSEEVFERAAIHGLKQRVSDAAAQSRDTKTGASAPPSEKFAAMEALVNHYNTGTSEWTLKGTGTRVTSDEQLLVRALAVVYPDRDTGKLREYVGKLTKVERAKLLVTGEIKTAAEMLREQDVGAVAVNTDELLAQLDAQTGAGGEGTTEGVDNEIAALIHQDDGGPSEETAVSA